MPIWASNGEFMVNAQATAKHRHLLERINAGFAAGGPIMLPRGGAPGAGGGGFGQEPLLIDLRLSDDLDARITSKSRDVSIRTMHKGLDEYSRKQLPGRARAAVNDQRSVG